MRRMPIPVRIAPFLPRGCPPGIYAGLALLSQGCPPDRGRLHTCYSPVRRSPAGKASFSAAAARLACVKPAASVHPEPGSNSPLLIISFDISCLFCPVPVLFPQHLPVTLPWKRPSGLRLVKVDGELLLLHVPLSLTLIPSGQSLAQRVNAACLVASLSMFSLALEPTLRPSSRGRRFSTANAKLLQISPLCKFCSLFFVDLIVGRG